MNLNKKDKERINALSTFMENLMKTKDKRNLVDENRALLNQVKPIDLFYVDMYKEDTPLDSEEIKATANKFVSVFYKGLKEHEVTTHKHPFMKALLEENEAIISHLKKIKPYIKENDFDKHQSILLKQFEACLEIEKKFVKKENIFFPKLEEHVPSTKPLEVMWVLHDDARAQIKKIIQYLKEEPIPEEKLRLILGTYYYLIYGIIQKEQLILFPVAIDYLTDEVMNEMYDEAMQYGFTFIEKTPRKHKDKQDEFLDDNVFKVRSGSLSFKQLKLMLNHLPVDITFVDKEDKVRYFNETKTRHFPRNPSVIGRLVEHCHPPKSVDTVKRILQAFKNKEKDFAEFWITFKDHFLYITYYAVYDENEHYAGILEVSQDVSHIKNLKGERRLLSWD